MGEQPLWKKVWSKWKKFLEGILDPVILLMLGASILLIRFSYLAKDNVIEVMLSILAMLATGILGAKAFSYYETGKLEEKGKSAIRSLKLMMNDLTKLEQRVRGFLPGSKSSKDHLEEIVDRTISLQDQAVGSIENWTDVFPDANVKSLVGEFSRAKIELETVFEEKQEIESELEKSKKEKQIGKARISELEEELGKKEAQLNSVKKTVVQKSVPLNTGLLSGLDLNASTFGYPFTRGVVVTSGKKGKLGRICKECGGFYVPDDFSSDSGYCEKCRGFQKKD